MSSIEVVQKSGSFALGAMRPQFVAGRMVDMWKQDVNEILARTDGAFTFPREGAKAIASDVIPLVREATRVPVGMAQPHAALAGRPS